MKPITTIKDGRIAKKILVTIAISADQPTPRACGLSEREAKYLEALKGSKALADWYYSDDTGPIRDRIVVEKLSPAGLEAFHNYERLEWFVKGVWFCLGIAFEAVLQAVIRN